VTAFYEKLIRPVLFRTDPERMHNASIRACELAGNHSLACRWASRLWSYRDDRLRQNIAGIAFENPLGVAAGYDKNGRAIRYVLFAAGGVFAPEDAYRKIRLGASLVQLYTGLIYRGPGIVRDVLAGLARLLERDGFANVAEAVGADFRM